MRPDECSDSDHIPSGTDEDTYEVPRVFQTSAIPYEGTVPKGRKVPRDERFAGPGSVRCQFLLENAITAAKKECLPIQIRKDNNGAMYLKGGRESSLVFRLENHRDAVCLFVEDFDVPFDNNLAERDLRNIKTKAKVSGGFRSNKGAQDYLDVMSYLSTARKHGIGMFDAMTAAFEGNPDIVLRRRSAEML